MSTERIFKLARKFEKSASMTLEQILVILKDSLVKAKLVKLEDADKLLRQSFKDLSLADNVLHGNFFHKGDHQSVKLAAEILRNIAETLRGYKIQSNIMGRTE